MIHSNNQAGINDLIKKNEALDQKFLFKKNFIPKQKPVMMIKTPNEVPKRVIIKKKKTKSHNHSMVFN